MAQDMIDEIRRAEKESSEAVQAARQAAKDRIEKARLDAQAAAEGTEKAAFTAQDSIWSETKKECARIAEQAAEDAKSACKALSATAERNRELTIQKLLDSLF